MAPVLPVPVRADAALVEELRSRFVQVLRERGMASMDEYGDMLKWGLPSRDGWCRYYHVYHPDWCSFSDAYKGTIHDHGGEIRGTVLLGSVWHDTYQARAAADGDRIYKGATYRLERHTTVHHEGEAYRLPAGIPHWIRPRALTVTYFQEEDNDVMGDLYEPVDGVHDEHTWTQEQADALVPHLIQALQARQTLVA